MPLFTRTRTNPVFYQDRLELLLSDHPARLEAMRSDPDNLDVLTWNIFAALDTHRDQQWLAYRLQALGGPNLRAPVRISLFSGAERMPLLTPSTAYLRAIHERTGVDHSAGDGVAAFEQPVEVPVRVETPDVLLLVDTGRDRLRAGAGGRDRIAELVDAGLEHARRLSIALSIGLVTNADSAVLRRRLPALEDRAQLAALVPWRRNLPLVEFHGLSWPELVALWTEEAADLDLSGQPVRAFRTYAERVAQ
jgi:hypothetical protein